MFTREFLEKFNRVNGYFIKLDEQRGESDHSTRAMRLMLKLSEEYGELSEAVLIETGLQRQSKIINYNRSHLEEEVVDVLIQILAIADHYNIDIANQVDKNLKKIEKRISEYQNKTT